MLTNNTETMPAEPITLEKNPKLEPSQDYYFLRRKGIEFIAEMGSRWWTDYNTHDPGITILEALCYAITELGYRCSWDIKDILAEPADSADQSGRQAFYTARDILTVNPLTVNDFRRILIDLEKVANAWLIGKKCACETCTCENCACETLLYADCKNDTLTFAHPEKQLQKISVAAKGTYDVLLELDHDPELGDLNDRKIQHTFIVKFGGKNHPIIAEFYFPAWDKAAWQTASTYINEKGVWQHIIDSIKFKAALNKTGQEYSLTPEEKNRRWRQWQQVFFADIKLLFTDVPAIEMQDVPFKLFGDSEARNSFKDVWELTDLISFDQAFKTLVAELYIKKTAQVEVTLQTVRQHLNDHRNLCEDFCTLSMVCVEDVAVCADIEITPDADIEQVLANVLFAVEQYFNPGIKFYDLQELMAENVPVDEIFDGPILNHGFIKQTDLDAAQLKSQLRTSDIINQLVEIEGIVAIKNLLLTRYDQDGQAISGVADTKQSQKKTSASWTLEISERCQPRLSLINSKFIFYKNELPFIPRASEVQDTLNQLRGKDERLKIRNLPPDKLDLPVTKGEYRPITDYYPIQNAFPPTYGIGFEGLPATSTNERQAQAKQLKGYLLFFEQMLSNSLAQIANVNNLFALDENQTNTYFSTNLRDDALIRDVMSLLKTELTGDVLEQLRESEPERLDRRNRFLDHLMARFAESFADYAMTRHSIDSGIKPVTQANLIKQKIAFLKNYPEISRNRAKSFNYLAASRPGNQPVLRQRIALLLGMPEGLADKIIIVEHLLLRPKFPGDAVMEVCLESNCSPCNGTADPYSFQMTVIMPGWLPPFNDNIDLRRFADRTIQLEIPAHLLSKVCWVSNLDYGEDWQFDMLSALTLYLKKNGKNAGLAAPSKANAQHGAEKLLAAAQAIFVKWFSTSAGHKFTELELNQAINSQLKAGMPELVTIYSGVKNYSKIGDDIFAMLTDYYTRIALADRWFLYQHFKDACEDWLATNTKFSWDNENVVRKIELTLVKLGVSLRDSQARAHRANQVAEQFGSIFSEQMKANVIQDKRFSTPDAQKQEVLRIFKLVFTNSILVDLGIAQKHADALGEMFVDIYTAYFDVTIKLWKVGLSLSKLQSIYPPATLHDCDDSNDDNPVRLGSTMLGG